MVVKSIVMGSTTELCAGQVPWGTNVKGNRIPIFALIDYAMQLSVMGAGLNPGEGPRFTSSLGR